MKNKFIIVTCGLLFIYTALIFYKLYTFLYPYGGEVSLNISTFYSENNTIGFSVPGQAGDENTKIIMKLVRSIYANPRTLTDYMIYDQNDNDLGVLWLYYDTKEGYGEIRCYSRAPIKIILLYNNKEHVFSQDRGLSKIYDIDKITPQNDDSSSKCINQNMTPLLPDD